MGEVCVCVWGEGGVKKWQNCLTRVVIDVPFKMTLLSVGIVKIHVYKYVCITVCL